VSHQSVHHAELAGCNSGTDRSEGKDRAVPRSSAACHQIRLGGGCEEFCRSQCVQLRTSSPPPLPIALLEWPCLTAPCMLWRSAVGRRATGHQSPAPVGFRTRRQPAPSRHAQANCRIVRAYPCHAQSRPVSQPSPMWSNYPVPCSVVIHDVHIMLSHQTNPTSEGCCYTCLLRANPCVLRSHRLRKRTLAYAYWCRSKYSCLPAASGPVQVPMTPQLHHNIPCIRKLNLRHALQPPLALRQCAEAHSATRGVNHHDASFNLSYLRKT